MVLLRVDGDFFEAPHGAGFGESSLVAWPAIPIHVVVIDQRVTGDDEGENEDGRRDDSAAERFEDEPAHAAHAELEFGVVEALFDGPWSDTHAAGDLFRGQFAGAPGRGFEFSRRETKASAADPGAAVDGCVQG